MGLFGKNKTFKIYGLDNCRVSINSMDISAFTNHKKISTLEYDGSDIYVNNDICITKYLSDDIRYDVSFEQKDPPKPKAQPKSKTAAKPKEETVAKESTQSEEIPKINLSKVMAEESKSRPFTLENLNIVIEGNIGSIDTDGNAEIKCHSIGDISCEGSLNIACDTIDGNINADGNVSVTGDVKGSVTTENDAIINGNIQGAVTVDGNFSNKGSVVTQDSIEISGDVNITGNVEAESISVDSTLTIGGNVKGDIESDGDVSIGGDFNGETINCDGGVKFIK